MLLTADAVGMATVILLAIEGKVKLKTAGHHVWLSRSVPTGKPITGLAC